MVAKRKVISAALVALIAVLTAELAVRVATHLAWRRGAHEFPEIARVIAQNRKVMRRLEPELAWTPPERFPAPLGQMKEGVWTTFGEFPEEGFRRPPSADAATPGTVRIAFIGESTTYQGYPERVGARMDERFGAGRVEVINMGVPVSWSGTSLVLMRRFLPRWRPHLIVLHHGINDILFARFFNLALWLRTLPAHVTLADLLGQPKPSRGLLDVLSPKREAPAPPIEIFAPRTFFLAHHWEIARFVWSEGADLFVTTFPAPELEGLDETSRRFFAADVTYLWPLASDLVTYVNDVQERNAGVVRFAEQAGANLIDAAAAVSGGREVFTDVCHLTDMGDEQLAEVVFEGLAPRVEALLADGPPPNTPPEPSPAYRPLAGPPPADHPRDGTCVRGPCPQGACFVPSGEAVCGFSDDQTAPLLEAWQTIFGWGEREWFEDEGPARSVSLSAFCIDRTEVTETRRQACVAARQCPPFAPPTLLEDAPAVMPTPLDAERYCAWAGGRLPTECEWEAAARGGDDRATPWGTPWTGEQANYCARAADARPTRDETGLGCGAAAPVGSFDGTSPYGLVDTAGNLWEWTLDCFLPYSYEKLPEGTRDPLFARTSNCVRPLRGGSFRSFPGSLERRTPEPAFDVLPDSRGVRCVYDFGTRHTLLPRTD